jgi:hypothetical protein
MYKHREIVRQIACLCAARRASVGMVQPVSRKVGCTAYTGVGEVAAR